MTKCNNCDNDALYRVDDLGADEIDYCRPCLPLHLLSAAENYAVEVPVPPAVVTPSSKK